MARSRGQASKPAPLPKRSFRGSYRSRPKRVHTTVGGISVDSGYEAKVLSDLEERGIPFSYNPDSLEIQLPLRGGHCTKCGGSGKELYKSGVYTVDVRLEGPEDYQWPTCRYVELKGRLTSFDRTRLKALWAAWGQKFKLFILFQRDNTINKGSKTRYSDWAKGVGFTVAVGDKIPQEWIE